MFGAIVGDCIGSFWEFSGNKNPAIPLWMPACRFTDDSVCTAAIADWVLGKSDLTTALHQRGRIHISAGFGDRMVQWLLSDTPKPYGSWGNGSAMRVSPVALMATSDEDALHLAAQSAMPTHGHPEAVAGAQATVFAIREAFRTRDPNAVLAAVEARFGYAGLQQRDPPSERADHLFDVSCVGTVPLAVAIACRSGSFDAAMAWCCSMGGDADTLGAIAGPISEALHGIPQQHLDNARARCHPEDEIWETIEAVYAHPAAQANLRAWGRIGGTAIAETDAERVGKLGPRKPYP